MRSLSMVSRLLVPAMLVVSFACVGPTVAQEQEKPAPKLDVPYVPTPQEVVDRMLEMADVQPDDYLIDLGSGDGRIPITAAKRYGIRAYGVDLNPKRVAEAKANAKEAGVEDKVTFEEKNLFETDISEADVLTMYLLSRVNMQLRPRILEELRPGTRVVSHAFTMQDWEPDESDKVENRGVYLWIVPARVEGRWKVEPADGEGFVLELDQEFQEISGTATMDGRSVPLQEVRLRGDLISFVLDEGDGQRRAFRGRVDGDSIKADQESAPGGGDGARPVENWSASRVS